jgi:hypothetical protein
MLNDKSMFALCLSFFLTLQHLSPIKRIMYSDVSENETSLKFFQLRQFNIRNSHSAAEAIVLSGMKGMFVRGYAIGFA